MPKSKSKHYFCPVPSRAMLCKKLTGLDLRLLSAICACDMFGRNGKHCFASHKTLAQMVECNEKSITDSIERLVSFGLIAEYKNPKDKRRKIYEVIYELESDRAAMGIDPVTEMKPIGSQSRSNTPSADYQSNSKNNQNLEENQTVVDYNDEPKISSKENQIKEKEVETESFDGTQFHKALAEKLGDGDLEEGWLYLMELEPFYRDELARKLYEGRLTDRNISNARAKAREKSYEQGRT